MKRILALALALCFFSLASSTVRADATFTVDQAHPWVGHMNVFDNPLDGGAYLWGSGWGVPDLVSIFDNNADTLTLSPNTIGDPNEYWYECTGTGTAPNCGSPGATGNKIMDANTYVSLPDNTYGGQTITFQGTVLANTLSGPHVAKAFIRDFDPSYGSYFESSVVLTPGPFSISLALDPGAGRHAQFGFNFNGPNVWITDVAPFGSVVVETVAAAGVPGDFDGDDDVDGRDFLLWQRDTNAGSLADWQQNYGAGTSGLAAVTAVPEPASLSLIASIVSLLVIRRNR
jgi:hypothetical protein